MYCLIVPYNKIFLYASRIINIIIINSTKITFLIKIYLEL